MKRTAVRVWPSGVARSFHFKFFVEILITADTVVEDLSLSARALNVLRSVIGRESYRRAPIRTVGELVRCTREDLLNRGGCGERTADELMACIQALLALDRGLGVAPGDDVQADGP